jgi:hypothetical protein
MAGAPDPDVAAALEAQSKSIDVQSRALAAQSKVLQQLCDRLESQDQRWSDLERIVNKNATNVSAIQEKLGEGRMAAAHEELTRVLGDRINAQMMELHGSQMNRIVDLAAQATTRVAALENATSVFELWRPKVESSIDVVRTSVDTMRSELARITQLLEGGASSSQDGRPSILGPYVPVAERPPVAAVNTSKPNGHHDALHHREYGVENGPIPTHLPNNGTHSNYLPQAPFIVPNFNGCHTNQHMPEGLGENMQEPYCGKNLGSLPKLNFPSFDGENPKLWMTRCEDYFLMYSVDPRMWIKVASMQFIGPAARWLQSVESRIIHISWGEFGRLVLERFGKDQHQLLLRQLFHVRQTGTVAAYVEFSQLIDQLNAYQSMSEPLYYTLKFVDGLRDDVKAVVMLQRPQDLDTAAILAQLQEEAGTLLKKKEYRWQEATNAPGLLFDKLLAISGILRRSSKLVQARWRKNLQAARTPLLMIELLHYMPIVKRK